MKTGLLIIIGIFLIITVLVLFVYDMKYEGWSNNEMFYMDGKMICDKVWFQNPQNCRHAYVITDTDEELIVGEKENEIRD